MEEEYYVKDKVLNVHGKYVPMSVKLYKSGTEKFKKYVKSGRADEILGLDVVMPKALYIVTLRHEGYEDGSSKGFILESDARKFIRNIIKGIEMKYGSMVELHYNLGVENIEKLLIDLDVDRHVSFSVKDKKGLTHKYSVGLSLYKEKLNKYGMTDYKKYNRNDRNEYMERGTDLRSLPIRRVSPSERMERELDNDWMDNSLLQEL